MKARGVHLQYQFGAAAQRGPEVANPLFDLLSAVREAGSIQHAATALGASYRHVWGALKDWEQRLGEPLVSWTKGRPAHLTPFAERLLWAEARARTRLVPHIEALRAELEQVLAEALDGRQQVLPLWASHDLALPRLRELAAANERLHLELRFAGSMDALRALAEGRCTVAGFHVPPLADAHNRFARALKPLLKPGRHKLIGCMKRVQGLLVAPGNPKRIGSLADLAVLRVVQRREGSGTRLLFEHLLDAAGGPWPGGVARVEDSHLALAATIASGQADAGLGVEAAAREFGLGFVPLVEEDYFLVCLAETLEEPAVRALRAQLAAPAWREALAALPGYRASDAGEVLSLTRALPWWRYRTPKPRD